MSKRSYGQYCALARAFDVIGERWTPLLLRELAMGPRRYADLQEGLPGVGTSLLAQRLKELEAEGLVQKRFLSPPAARWVYDLTAEGRELAEAMIPLARWGVKRLGVRREGETFSLSWLLLFLRETTDKELTRGAHDVYEFHVDDWVFHVIVDDGRIDAQAGPAPQSPDLKVTTDFETFAAVGSGELRADDPRFAEHMHVEGDAEAAQRCLRIMTPAFVGASAA
ncbi:MAG: putative transcriptional regulator [Acidimicrobiales bacterium]|nr:putative transcriptional regulator [Acidimicrobiales bacterium]